MFGSHLSIAGSMCNALREAESLAMDAVQVFTKNQQQWKAPPLDPGMAREWLAETARLGWQARTVSHASYLINLASPDDALWHKSIALMREEIDRCEALGIPFLVHHPGAAMGQPAEAALARIAAAYGRLFTDTPGYATVCCLENTVGAGTTIGREFEQLALLRSLIAEVAGEPSRIGFCFDTCHAHAGGYDLSTRAAADAALDHFDRTCGLAHLKVVHVNDSKAALGSRRDLHEHIGQGALSREGGTKDGPLRPLHETGFAAIVNRPELRSVPKILETPKGKSPEGDPHDSLNLARLRGLQTAPGAPILSGAKPRRAPRRTGGPRTASVDKGKSER